MDGADGADNRSRILNAAAEEFMRAGFDAATVDDVAGRIGQTKGLIYYHFRSKVEIFNAVYERGMAMILGEVEPLAQASGSGFDRLERMAHAHVAHLLDYPAYHNILRQGIEQRLQLRLTEAQRRKLAALTGLRDRYEALFRTVIGEGITDGSVRAVPVALAARTLLGGLNAVNVWYRYKSAEVDLDDPEAPAVISGILVGGLRNAD